MVTTTIITARRALRDLELAYDRCGVIFAESTRPLRTHTSASLGLRPNHLLCRLSREPPNPNGLLVTPDWHVAE
jgi:hypothetical protein